MLVSLKTDAERALTGSTLGHRLALRSQKGIGGLPFLTPHSLQRLDLLEEVADEDVDGGVLLGLPVSQHVLESDRGVFMINLRFSYLILCSQSWDLRSRTLFARCPCRCRAPRRDRFRCPPVQKNSLFQ